MERIQGDYNNNKMERMNGEVRDREKIMRGLTIVDKKILPGCQIYHNYFRPHEALKGKTPAEKLKATQEALALREKLTAGDPKNQHLRADHAASLHAIGLIRRECGRIDQEDRRAEFALCCDDHGRYVCYRWAKI